jgi:hypothetical protein
MSRLRKLLCAPALYVRFLYLGRICGTRPPDSSSNPSKISSSETITLSPTLHLRNPFNYNTYKSPYKCCKQKTYAKANSFKCNTYKKQGGRCRSSAFNLPTFQRSTV